MQITSYDRCRVQRSSGRELLDRRYADVLAWLPTLTAFRTETHPLVIDPDSMPAEVVPKLGGMP